MVRNIIKGLLHRYVYQDWNIGIADVSDDLTPTNVRWMRHSYKDRWFADPFIVDETKDCYIILAEECLHGKRGRIVRLWVSKADFTLLKNEILLELESHLSFPNIIEIDGKKFLYPENAQHGNTRYYAYGDVLKEVGVLSDERLADPVIFEKDGQYFMLATVGDDCNGNILKIFRSEKAFGSYEEVQQVVFNDNVARRAGNIFVHNNKMISPAQICNHEYGEGISFQEISFDNEKIKLTEIKRVHPPTKEYREGFHTFNVYGDKVIIDGYRYGSPLLHWLYFKFRK